MTNERIAIESLAYCTFLPGSFNKRFAHNLNSYPEDKLLTVKQRQTLWKLVNRYRRQIRTEIVHEEVARREAMDPTALTFEDMLDSDPMDNTTRLIYADWLDEHDGADLADAHRWIVAQQAHPKLQAAGMEFGPTGIKPINFEWTFGKSYFDWEQNREPYWARSQREIVASMARLLARIKQQA